MQKRENGQIGVQLITDMAQKARTGLPAIGRYFYAAFTFAVALVMFWVGLAFVNSTGIADIRPALQASLGSLSAFFGGEPPALAPVSAAETFSAPGQVTALSEFEVKAGVGSTVTSIVQEGAIVAEGDVIAQLDDREAKAELRSAEADLNTARHELEQARSGASAVGIDEVSRGVARDQAFVALSDVHVNLAWIVPSLESTLEDNDVKESVGNAYAYADLVSPLHSDITQYRDRALESSRALKNRYAALAAKYRALTRGASQSELESIMGETYAVLKDTADALKDANDFLTVIDEQFEEQGQEKLAPFDGHKSVITDAQVTTNDSLEQLSGAMEGLRPAAPPAPVDLRPYELAVAEAESDVEEAKTELEKFVVRAPIAGTVARSDVQRGSSVVNGEILARIITEETVARISLSEGDVAQVSKGDAVTVHFDGIEGFSLPGTVLSVDPVATVENGNVTFYAIVGFDSPDERIRPGMTVTAVMQK